MADGDSPDASADSPRALRVALWAGLAPKIGVGAWVCLLLVCAVTHDGAWVELALTCSWMALLAGGLAGLIGGIWVLRRCSSATARVMGKSGRLWGVVVLGVLALGAAGQHGWRRTHYVGMVTCRFRTETTCFGFKVGETEDPGKMGDVLAAWVGRVPEREYRKCGYDSLLLSVKVGTPPGNWYWVMRLQQQVVDGRPTESARRIAQNLVSADQAVQQRAKDELWKFEATSSFSESAP